MQSTVETLFEDDFILVVNKPSGLVVNNSATSSPQTLQNLLKSPSQQETLPPEPEDELIESEFTQREGIVHRLDKDTSGVLIVAKNEEAFTSLQKQFKDRTIAKEYVAWVIGEIADDKFEINAPIKRNPRSRFKFAVVADGKDAFTAFEKVKTVEINDQKATLLKVYPKTGRTHQIRVHLSAFDHPIIGDEIYGTKKQLEDWYQVFPRLMLHSQKITFNHPINGNLMSVEAPLPPEFMLY